MSDESLIERKLSSKKIYSGRIVSLRKDKVRLPNGKVAVREVVEHPSAVVIVPLLDDGRVVMVKQYRQPAGRILLELPAGILKRREDPVECARRELLEETGYEAHKLQRMISFYVAPGYSTEIIHTFKATGLTKGIQNTDDDEFIEVVEVNLDDCSAMIRRNEIIDAKTICGIHALALGGR